MTFEESWGKQKAKGYNYGEDALEQVRFGWDLRNEELGVPHYAACFFRDGAKWCCTRANFINLQESPAGFGDTMEEALKSLHAEEDARCTSLNI